MQLIYITDKDAEQRHYTARDRRQECPPNDIEPMLLALLRGGKDFILRDAGAPPPPRRGSLAGVDRYSVAVDQARQQLRAQRQAAAAEVRDLAADGDVQVAVALATIYFSGGSAAPREVDYVAHIEERCRLADKLVLVGYTDPLCSMGDSEELAYRRACEVRTTLDAAIDIPIVAIARPLCRYAPTDCASRRVEVACLYCSAAVESQAQALGYGLEADGDFECEARVAIATTPDISTH